MALTCKQAAALVPANLARFANDLESHIDIELKANYCGIPMIIVLEWGRWPDQMITAVLEEIKKRYSGPEGWTITYTKKTTTGELKMTAKV